MADIVFTFAASNGPTMNTPPEKWLTLGEKDQYDARFDYQWALAHVKPNIEQELTLEVFKEKAAAIQRDIATLTEMLDDARPDVVVVISNSQGGVATDVQHPVFGVHLNEEPPLTERAFASLGGPQTRTQWPVPERIANAKQYPTDGELASHLIRGLIKEKFDVAANYQSRPGAGLGASYNLLYERFDLEAKYPYVPVLVSRYLPNQPLPERCYEFGQALRGVIERWDSNKRVAVMGSGGLSHQIIDEDLDRMVVRALQDGNAAALGSIPIDDLNRAPGTPEILNWVVCAGLAEPTAMTLLDYLPCYRSIAGTGHGNTFGYWK